MNKLILKETNQSFDTLTTDAVKKDYSFTLLEATYLERTGLRFEPSDYVSFGLADKNGVLTNAGKLMTDQHTVYNLEGDAHQVIELSTVSKQILAFCTTPKSKKELAVFCGFKDLRNFTLKHINPLLKSGQSEMTIPDKPKSHNQKYITVHSE